MDYCLLITQFASGLTSYSVQCFETPEIRSSYVGARLNRKPREEWLAMPVMRGESLTGIWQYAITQTPTNLR